MEFIRRNGMVLGLILVLIAAVSFMISWDSTEDDLARELEAEPDISVYFHETGEIKTMKLEEYLQGVVAGEMFPDWPVEAYAAQAIFARSFTMAFLADGGLKEKYGADISTDINEAQAYNAQAITPEITKAVEMTRGQVMTYDNRFVKAWFHAYSGGITATAVEGLGYQEEEPPYIRSTKLPDNQYVPEDVKNWSTEYSRDELQALLAAAGVNVGNIQGINILEKGPTERITKLEIIGDSGTTTVHGQEFRQYVDSTRMKSTLVSDFEFSDGVLKVAGTGYGHGVGLSQWDAYQMAKDGSSPEEIVKTFFKDIEIQKLYD
ncbi:MAG: SpoIID/LytB domain-containing protein [Firmicutes bacterium]|nr:SpoIID/LytB domain-containing protein [Bacillota bacterium]